MVKVLTFADGDERKTSEKRFEMLYEGLHYGGAEADRKDGFKTVRLEAEVLKALTSISEEKAGATPMASGDLARSLLAGAQTITLKQPSLTLLKDYIERTRWKVSSSVAAVDAVDFIDAAPEQKDEE